MDVPTRPLAACFGAGGAFGLAFDLGVANALREAGLPVATGAMLGTSAGAWTSAALATGVAFDEVIDAWEEYGRTPPAKRTRVIDLTDALFGDRHEDRVGTVAMRLPSMRRVVLRGDRYRLADAVAASSSPPRLAAAHRIDGQRYIDAGVARSTSADLAPRARVLVVVSPMAGAVLGRLGMMNERVTRYEMGRWRLRSGGDLLYVRPPRAVAALAGSGTAGLFDFGAARRTYRAAYELGLRCAERFRGRHPQPWALVSRKG